MLVLAHLRNSCSFCMSPVLLCLRKINNTWRADPKGLLHLVGHLLCKFNNDLVV